MKRERTRKSIALFFITIMSLQLVTPSAAYALTSGPAQPEMTKFAPAGNTDMVDLFTGDLKYNIPLMDIGGYPVNLAYQSGTSMEEEASWVGMGWTLNAGAINRAMRGLPDDFDGSAGGDRVEKIFDQKDFKKVGGSVTIKPSILGWETGSLSGSIKLNVYKDNLYGMGASVGAGVSVSQAMNSNSSLTAGLGVDVTSDNRDGVSFTPSLTLATQNEINGDENYVSRSLTGSLTYNSRAGLKDFTLSESFSTHVRVEDDNYATSWERAGTHYFGQSYTPTMSNNKENIGATFNFDIGPSPMGIYIGFGGSGYFYTEKNLDKKTSTPAYGYFNHAKGQGNTNALLDFNREKDGVFLKSTPSIGIPVATHDFFMATGQAGSSQFRPYYSGNYVTFDKEFYNRTNNTNAGITLGFANGFKAGARLEFTNGESRTKKWVDNNLYLTNAQAYVPSYSNIEENVYFKNTGERTMSDMDFYNTTGGKAFGASRVGLSPASWGNIVAMPQLKSREENISSSSGIRRYQRDLRTSNISYLSALNAGKYGLDKQLKIYNQNSSLGNTSTVERYSLSNNAVRKPHHISEITITDNGGKRMVYGVPVYNNKQEEYTVSVAAPALSESVRAKKEGLLDVPVSSNTPSGDYSNITYKEKGRYEMISRTITPGYANSWLLSGILSPDYVDVKEDGITDDDLGTAIKFNYSKLPNIYKWRTPYSEPNLGVANKTIKANYNEGFLSDPKDDKASIVYGEKEVWYMHSVSSKAMIAFFETSNREDALGVKNVFGEKDPATRLKKLDRIKLYSKADWLKNGTNAVPVKVVHFEYDYSLYPGVPNNTGNSLDKSGAPLATPETAGNVNANRGKLTLRRVYFTFGNSTRGESNPYIFGYDERKIKETDAVPENTDLRESEDEYAERQADRWGTYKQPFYNHLGSGQALFNNSEFPYSLQKNTPIDGQTRPELIDRFASKWQLNNIITPAGAIITAQYESDDYAFVQDRQAMQMCFVTGYSGGTNGLISADKLSVSAPGVSTSPDFKQRYLVSRTGEKLKQLFFRLYVNLDNRGHYEYVNGYAEIDWSRESEMIFNNGSGAIPVKQLGSSPKYSPFSKAAWQILIADLPQYAYDNYDNSEFPGSDFEAAIRSMVTSIGNLGDLGKTPDERAINRRFATQANVSKSIVRLYNPDGKKTGGGCRVKYISMTDNWSAMAKSGNVTTTTGQHFDYTTTDNKGNTISSGVASYEPSAGNEENPFHEPVNYTEAVKWSSDRNHYIEKPYCETYFPAASVGYSKVTVTSTGNDYTGGPVVPRHIGYIVNEFYTAKDFPTIVDDLKLEAVSYENHILMRLFTGRTVDRMATSQGFKIELNDMHGKQKAVFVYDRDDKMLTSSEYLYKEKDKNTVIRQLDNAVDVLAGGTIYRNKTIATDLDFTSDMRQSVTENRGNSYGVYFGGVFLAMFSFPFGAANPGETKMINQYHSISNVKVIQRYGILHKTITTKYGSTMEAENLLWDGNTGEVILSRTQNEFEKYTYSFSYPAYLAYEGMGSASINTGGILFDVNLGTNGNLGTNSYYLFPGDELIEESNAPTSRKRLWVIRAGDESLRAVDEKGEFATGSGKFLLQRSGRRNMLAAGAGTVITMNDPRVFNPDGLTGYIDPAVEHRVLDSKALVYKDEWAVPVNNVSGESLHQVILNPSESVNGKDGYYYRNFLIKNNSTNEVVCNDLLFGAETNYSGTAEPSRGFMEFQVAPFLPGNLDIESVTLSLYASQSPSHSMHGNNEAYIKRVIRNTAGELPKYCGVPDVDYTPVNWLNQPAVTESNRVQLPRSTADHQDYLNIDLTAMFLEWYYSYPVSTLEYPEFKLRMNMINEYTAEDKEMMFQGAGGSNKPVLTINYRVSTTCEDPVGKKINPYFKGVLGNWRQLSSYIYTVNREQKVGNAAVNGGTDIRNSGYYKTYTPFWSLDATGLHNQVLPGQDIPSNDNRWVWSNRSVHYDQKGNEIESTDPLHRYGSALFGYQQSLATAVGANARHNELAFDGFEDYYFDVSSGSSAECPLPRHLDFGFTRSGGNWTATGGTITTAEAHTGNYSVRLNGTLAVTKQAGSASPSGPILAYDGSGRYILQSNELAKGFAPVNGKDYLLSLWVNDHNNTSNKIQGLSVSLNGNPVTINDLVVPVVEGWKLLELKFTAGAGFSLQLSGSAIEVDDIRLFPYDGQCNSYVYDDKTLRLVAKLDENNFATFYEYNEEGTPIRVKKETERGIMTIKENRQSLKQTPTTVQ